MKFFTSVFEVQLKYVKYPFDDDFFANPGIFSGALFYLYILHLAQKYTKKKKNFLKAES